MGCCWTRFTLALLVLVGVGGGVWGYNPNSHYYGSGRRIAMDSIKTLTFYSGRKTAFRRTHALPQLTCVGSCDGYTPDVVQCQSMGDGQWKCSADLPSWLRMGRVEVSCEGYDYAEDAFVLKDSCALEYRLLPNRRVGDDPWRSYGGKGDKVVGLLFWVVFVGVIGLMVVSFFKDVMRRNGGGHSFGSSQTGRGGGGGSGGGGWWPGGSNGNNPPPPYTPKTEPNTSTSTASSWRPGFWTGLGLGGLAATAASTRIRRPTPHYPPQSEYYFNSHGFEHNLDAGPSSFRRPSARSSWDNNDSASSSGWRESTGFGGTRNR